MFNRNWAGSIVRSANARRSGSLSETLRERKFARDCARLLEQSLPYSERVGCLTHSLRQSLYINNLPPLAAAPKPQVPRGSGPEAIDRFVGFSPEFALSPPILSEAVDCDHSVRVCKRLILRGNLMR